MLSTDSALLYQIVRAAADPDPRVVARYRPFASLPAQWPLDELPARAGLTLPTLRLPRVLTALRASFRAALPARQPAATACCCC